MFSRLSPVAVFRASWRALGDYRATGFPKPDRFTRVVLVAVPPAAGAAMFVGGGVLKGPDSLLTALALLAGGFLTAFTHLSGVRQRLTEREEHWGEAERIDRDSVDETTAHLLAASYASLLAVALVLVGLNVSTREDGALEGLWAGLTVGALAYLGLLAMITFPRLYSAYAVTNKVRFELNGNTQGHSR